LHQLVEVAPAPGLSDLVLEYRDHGDGPEMDRQMGRAIVGLEHGPRSGELDMLPSGRKVQEPAQLLSGEGLDLVFERLAQLDYAYVLVDAPPMLGIADTQSLARCADHLLYVARLDRITLDNLMDARDILDRLEARPIASWPSAPAARRRRTTWESASRRSRTPERAAPARDGW